ncbi:hypothetical protein Ahu01nite_000520 [Winogradskya humida]|uniref:Sigma-70-like protein n=2 Tax=Winogradskya humida TaxID=113566 RepID=A0ABQ3ZEH2_9ACTN|nr:hypothetical protein Ahu01nite_000520 [Actinoplanes humidus]
MSRVLKMLTTQGDPITVGADEPPPMEFLLRSLPNQHLEILAATYFGGRTTTEAAQLLGLAPEVAKARLYHAMRDLSRMVAISRPGHLVPRTRGASGECVVHRPAPGRGNR